MKYSVFDLSINRLHAIYDTPEEAFALVASLLSVNDDGYADDLAVVPTAESGGYGEPMTGDALRACVKGRAAGKEAVSVGARRQGYGSGGGGYSADSCYGPDRIAASGDRY